MEALQLSRIIIAAIALVIVAAGVCMFAYGRPQETWTGNAFKYAKWTHYGCIAATFVVLVGALYLFKTTGDIKEGLGAA